MKSVRPGLHAPGLQLPGHVGIELIHGPGLGYKPIPESTPLSTGCEGAGDKTGWHSILCPQILSPPLIACSVP